MDIGSHSLTFVNHASVLIKGLNKAILTDPWYFGDSFHKGWKLIHENDDSDIEAILASTSHIWISHEHPDHFSIAFFKKFKTLLRDNGITVLFQQTRDRRVIGFLEKEGFATLELPSGQPLELEDGFSLRLVKDEFYDSALLCRVDGVDIFNLNDCPIHSPERIENFKRRHGRCDILLTQFSYAAWKGGRSNQAWRAGAAREKLDSLIRQADILCAKVVIPFASFVWFSNELNGYLNDSINSPRRVVDFCASRQTRFKCLVMQPLETVKLRPLPDKQSAESLMFWDEEFAAVHGKVPESYSQSFDVDSLVSMFKQYCERLRAKNSWLLITLISKLRFLGVFSPVTVRLFDTEEVLSIDLPNGSMKRSLAVPDVALHSESLAFIFKNAFGFDTLTVNGTFEEVARGGFGRFTKTFALENMNNLGYSLKPSIFFNITLLSIFASRLSKVAKKLK